MIYGYPRWVQTVYMENSTIWHEGTSLNPILLNHVSQSSVLEPLKKGPWLEGMKSSHEWTGSPFFSSARFNKSFFWVFCSLKNQEHRLTDQPNPKNTCEFLFLEQRKREMQKETHVQTNQPTFCPSWLSVWPPGTAQDLVLISDELINKGTETAETQRFYRFLNLL